MVDTSQARAGGTVTAPHRVLVVSADMGGGHNATAAALEETVEGLWPGSETHRVDSLDVMGPGIGPLFRRIYVGNVQQTPWLYEFFYASLWRHRWFAQASKRFVGSWCGRRLVRHLERFDPDLVVSTYPLGSAGLAWLRRHRGLSLPLGCWVSDFAPHPFWVYSDLDLNVVMHEDAAPLARVADRDVRVEVSGPAVVAGFGGQPDTDLRCDLGLRQDALVVLVSCGAYGFGDVTSIVRSLVAASPDVQVVAVCGHNDEVRCALDALGLGREALVTVGWTDRMADWMHAADLVLTNAGGATALEALAAGKPVVTSTPIAAHGRANADLMTTAGLTELCDDTERLTALVAHTARDRRTLEPLRLRIGEHTRGRGLGKGLRRLARTAGPGRGPAAKAWPLRSADAFFAHVETDTHRQELGAVLEVDGGDGNPLTAARVRASFAPRLAGLPPARRVLCGGPRPGWRLVPEVDLNAHIEECVLAPDDPDEIAWEAVARLWARPLPPGRPAWSALVVRGRRAGPDLFGIKLHHCLGDGISALGLMDRLLDPGPGDALPERRPPSDGARARTRTPGPGSTVAGLSALAARRRAPRHPLGTRPQGTGRTLATVRLPWPEVRRLARRHDVASHELVIGLVADALAATLRPAGLLGSRSGRTEPLRAMVPTALRAPTLDRIAGNWTGAVAVDLPMGPLRFDERMARVHAGLTRKTAPAEAPVAAAVIAMTRWLPAALRPRLARKMYSSTHFNTIVSFMPGARGPRTLAGARVRAIYPVLPLAPGIPLTVGAVVADQSLSIGILLDPALGIDRTEVQDATRQAFTRAGAGG